MLKSTQQFVSFSFEVKVILRITGVQPLDDIKTLSDSGFTSSTARAQAPATIGMVYRNAGKDRVRC